MRVFVNLGPERHPNGVTNRITFPHATYALTHTTIARTRIFSIAYSRMAPTATGRLCRPRLFLLSSFLRHFKRRNQIARADERAR